MNKIKNIFSNRHFTTFLLILSIILIAVISFREVFGYFFTASETVTLIDKSRIKSFDDIIRILTDDLMSGTGFSGRFYRPLLVLSLSMDYHIWGLDPFGYHLTDLIIHILVSISVFFLARSLSGGKNVVAWLSAVIFTTNPVIISAVIGTDKRNDTLAGLFLMLSLLNFLKHHSLNAYKKLFLTLSLFFYALSFGSKEIGVIVPLVVFSYLLIFSDETSPKTRIANAVKRTVPYFITAFILVAWRAFILSQWVGGYKSRPDDIIILNYFSYLINPTGFFDQFSNSVIIFLLPLIPLSLSLVFYKRIISGIGGIRTFKVILLIGLIFSSIVILLYPLLIEPSARSSFYNNGPHFFQTILKGHVDSLSLYLWNIRMYFFNRLYNLLFFFVICLAGVINYGYNRDHFFPVSTNGKILTFLFLWLLSPLGIYLLVLSLAPWQMYVPFIPFSIMLSMIFTESIKSLSRFSHLSLFRRIHLPLITGILLLILMLYSAPFGFEKTGRNQDGWRDITKARSIVLHALLASVSESPNNITKITIHNLPFDYWLPSMMVKSWYNLNYPDNNVKEVIVKTVPPVQTNPVCLDFDIKLNEIDATMKEVSMQVNACKKKSE